MKAPPKSAAASPPINALKSPGRNNAPHSLELLLKEVTGEDEIYQAIISGSRKRFLSVFKKRFIERAIQANYTMREIGDFLSVSEVAIYKMSIKE